MHAASRVKQARRLPIVLLIIAVLWVISLSLLQWQQPQPPQPPQPSQPPREQNRLPAGLQNQQGIAHTSKFGGTSASYMCNRMSMELPAGVGPSVLALAALGGPMLDPAGASAPSATLQQNVSVAGHVREEQYAYYQVCLAHHTHEHVVSFEVVCSHGDADLYISTEDEHPALDRATWISADKGDDRITLHTDMPEFAQAARLGSAGSQVLYVAVYGRTEANFAITVLVRDAAPKPIRRRPRSLRGNKHQFVRHQAKRRQKLHDGGL